MPLTREICEEIKRSVNNTLTTNLKDTVFIKTLADMVSQEVAKTIATNLINKLDIFEKDIQAFKEEMNYNKNDLNSLENEIKMLIKDKQAKEGLYDRMDQEARKNNLRIYNYRESPNESVLKEVISLFNNKMNLKLTDDDIEQCYRVGKEANNQKPRGIFIKFSDPARRREVYRNKKLLKGTRVIIREDLTTLRLQLMTKAVEMLSVKEVWTDNGRVLANIQGKVTTIKSNDDLKKYFP